MMKAARIWKIGLACLTAVSVLAGCGVTDTLSPAG